MSKIPEQKVKLDLNNPVFQRQLFNLQKRDQREILGTLRKLSNMILAPSLQQPRIEMGDYCFS